MKALLGAVLIVLGSLADVSVSQFYDRDVGRWQHPVSYEGGLPQGNSVRRGFQGDSHVREIPLGGFSSRNAFGRPQISSDADFFPSRSTSEQAKVHHTRTEEPHHSVLNSPAIHTQTDLLSNGSKRFQMDLLTATGEQFKNSNFMIAPHSIWSLILLMVEGANGLSLEQLQRVLDLPQNFADQRQAFQHIQTSLAQKGDAIELDTAQALIYDRNSRVNESYTNILRTQYNAETLPINFQDANNATKEINRLIRSKTHNKIQKFLEPTSLANIRLMLVAASFFKGKWKSPFDPVDTKDLPFYGDNGELIGNVPMMHQRSFFRTATIESLGASFIELPYGDDGQICMWLELPFTGNTATQILNNLRSVDVSTINHELHKWDNHKNYEPPEVYLTVPKFKIRSSVELTDVLRHLGITHVFDANNADLSKISKQSPHFSKVQHKAVIDVNEAGTVAAGAAGATVTFKQLPSEYKFDRPFNFMIVDRPTNTLLFAGKVQNPAIN